MEKIWYYILNTSIMLIKKSISSLDYLSMLFLGLIVTKSSLDVKYSIPKIKNIVVKEFTLAIMGNKSQLLDECI